MKARAVQLAAPRRVELIEVELRSPGEGDVLVRTLFSGISAGTEMLVYRGEVDEDAPLDEAIAALEGTFRYPFRYGYSCVGRVERSEAALPEGALVFAFQPHQEAFVEQAVALVPLGDVDPRAATLFPLVETALQIVLDAGNVLEEVVVVLGLGVVGILTAILLARAGAHPIASEPQEWRRDLAASLGVRAVTPEEVQRAVDAATAGRGAALVIDASGDPRALGPALALLRHEGAALVASWFGSKTVALPLGRHFHRRRLSIVSTQVSTIPSRLASAWTIERRRSVAASLLDELPLKMLATHEFALEEAAEAFAAVDRGERGLMHAALRYD